VLAVCVPRPALWRFARASRGVWKSYSKAFGRAKILVRVAAARSSLLTRRPPRGNPTARAEGEPSRRGFPLV